MKNILSSLLILILSFLLLFCSVKGQTDELKIEETVFVFGGDISQKFIQYVADLTKSDNPRICYLPTASADNQENITYWENVCKKIGIAPLVLKVWVSSSPTAISFEDILLNCDAIIVGGGNTLNMLGIWYAQGIDSILHKALKKGIILAGGSAGSICWFQGGISDSRPVSISFVNGLNYLPFSNCPHYSNDSRRKLYHQLLAEEVISSGYACDELAGILFKDGKAVEFVSQSDKHNSYFVKLHNGIVNETKMDSKILLNKNALTVSEYERKDINRKIKDLLQSKSRNTPLDAYVATINELFLQKADIKETEKDKRLNTGIEKIYCYDDKIAGVVNTAYNEFYGLWYFYNSDGTWVSEGEDIGGETLLECEITFRERAKVILEKAQKRLIK